MRDKQCHKCNRVGHFAIKSRSKQRKPQPHDKNSVHFLDIPEESSDLFSDTVAAAQVCALESHANTTTVNIANVPIQVIINLGASCNMLSTVDLEKLATHRLKLHACNRTLFPYNSSPLKVTQCLVADVQFVMICQFLLNCSFFLAPSLHYLHLACTANLSSISAGAKKNPYFGKYPGLCEGTGKLKNHHVKLHIDKSVPPVARKHSCRKRTPEIGNRRHHRDRHRSNRMGIMHSYSTKNPSEIRLCIDMRNANKAICQTQHAIPTTEQLVSDLNGDTVFFSKINLCSGYHQLQLDPMSRYITIFSTHTGVYRYKRLLFGLNSDAEVFQHTIQEVIAGTSGARNLSDDIICFGSNQAEHDRTLGATLHRLDSSGPMVNEQKCKFNKDETEIFSFIFSAAFLFWFHLFRPKESAGAP